MRTKAVIKKAAVPAAAISNKQQSKPYRKAVPVSRSNLKENLGLLLYHLQSRLTQKQHRMGWQLFGVMLRQYVDLKYVRAE